jgi:hypothetical protein
MNIENFRLEYQGRTDAAKRYIIVWDCFGIGEIEFLVSPGGVLHIYSVFINDTFRGKVNLWKFFQQAEKLLVYNVQPEAIIYWLRLHAEIVNTVDNRFSDIIIEEGDFNDI